MMTERSRVGIDEQVHMRLHAALRQPVERVAVRALRVAIDSRLSHVQYLARRTGSRQPLLGSVSAARGRACLDNPTNRRLRRCRRCRCRRIQRSTHARVPHHPSAAASR